MIGTNKAMTKIVASWSSRDCVGVVYSWQNTAANDTGLYLATKSLT